YAGDVYAWRDALGSDGVFADLGPGLGVEPGEPPRDLLLASAERLAAMAHLHLTSGSLLAAPGHRGAFLAAVVRTNAAVEAIDGATEEGAARRGGAATQLGRVALLGDGVLVSAMLDVDQATRDLGTAARDGLLRVVAPYYTILGAFGQNVDLGSGTVDGFNERAFSVVEEGTFEFGDRLRVETAGLDAFVEAETVNVGAAGGTASLTMTRSGTTDIDDVHVVDWFQNTPAAASNDNVLLLSSIQQTVGIVRAKLGNTGPGMVPTSAILRVTSTTEQPPAVTLRASRDAWGPVTTGAAWSASALTSQTYHAAMRPHVVGAPIGSSASADRTYTFDVTDAVRRSIALGDANLDGDINHLIGASGVDRIALGADVEAAYLAIRDWSAYVRKFGGMESDPNPLLYAVDANWDNVATSADGRLVLRRLGVRDADFNLDGRVNSADLAIFEGNFQSSVGAPASVYGDGDANFDGWIDANDRDLFTDTFNAFTYTGPVDASPYFVLSTAGAGVNLVSSEGGADGPSLTVDFAPAPAVLRDFHARGNSGLAVVSVQAGDTPFNGAVQIWAEGEAAPRVEVTVNASMGAVGNGTVTTSMLGAINESTRLYARIVDPVTGRPQARSFTEGILTDAAGRTHVFGSALSDVVVMHDNSVAIDFGNDMAFQFGVPHANGADVFLHLGAGKDGLLAYGYAGDVRIDGGAGDDLYFAYQPSAAASGRLLQFANAEGIDELRFWGSTVAADVQAVSVLSGLPQTVGFSPTPETHNVQVQLLAPRAVQRVFSGAGVQNDLSSVPIVVDTLSDDDDGDFGPGELSVREALRLTTRLKPANLTSGVRNGVVQFDPGLTAAGPATISLTDGVRGVTPAARRGLEIHSSIQFVGPGAGLLTVDAGVTTRGLFLRENAQLDVSVSGVTITRGRGNGGGGIRNVGNALTLDGVRVTNSVSISGILPLSDDGGNADAYSSGGGLLHEATTPADVLVVRNSSFEGNIGAWGAGALVNMGSSSPVIESSLFANNRSTVNGGGLSVVSWQPRTGASANRTTIRNSTFTANRTHMGGGIWIEGGGAAVDVVNSTVTGNVTGEYYAGVGVWGQLSDPDVALHNTIVVGNFHTNGDAANASAGWVDFNQSSSNNVIGGNASWLTNSGPWSSNSNLRVGATDGSGNPTDQLAGLLPLADNGGPTKTHALRPDSRAIDAGLSRSDSGPGALVPAIDQRGLSRHDVPSRPGLVDVGASEYQGVQVSVAAPTTLRAPQNTAITMSGPSGIRLEGYDIGSLSLELRVPSQGVAGFPAMLSAPSRPGQSVTVFSFTGTMDQINAALTSVTATPVAGFVGVAPIVYTLRHGTDALQTGAVELVFAEVNESIVVTSAGDAPVSGKLTLREAIEQAAEGGKITFSPELNGKTIQLGPSGDLIVRKSLTIDATALPDGLTIQAYDPDGNFVKDADGNFVLGPGGQLVKDADGSRLFHAQGATTHLELRGLTLTGGDSEDHGGAIRADAAEVTLDRVHVVGNAAPRQPGYDILRYERVEDPSGETAIHKKVPILGPYKSRAAGGGIYSTGSLKILDSRFANNFTAGVYNRAAQSQAMTEALRDRDDLTGPAEKDKLYSGDLFVTGDVTIVGTTFTSDIADRGGTIGEVYAGVLVLSVIHKSRLRSELDPGDGEVRHAAEGVPEGLWAGRWFAGTVVVAGE
ncbi:MAG: choice-of-anchor Q domain-containing protein, partial [Lacipirellulaceae bacterium]